MKAFPKTQAFRLPRIKDSDLPGIGVDLRIRPGLRSAPRGVSMHGCEISGSAIIVQPPMSGGSRMLSILIAGLMVGETAYHKPSDSWNLNFEARKCSLGRTFDVAGSQVKIDFGEALSSWSLLISLPRKRVPKEGEAIVQPADGSPINARYEFSKDWETGPGVMITFANRTDFRRAISSGTLVISGIASDPLALETGGSAQASQRMTACHDDLIASWGIDPAQHALIETPAEGAPVRFITNADYPSEAIMMRQRGSLFMVWEIDAEKAVRNCRIIVSSGFPQLDGVSCAAITKRGLYLKPAMDKDGRPVRSWGSRRMRFGM